MPAEGKTGDAVRVNRSGQSGAAWRRTAVALLLGGALGYFGGLRGRSDRSDRGTGERNPARVEHGADGVEASGSGGGTAGTGAEAGRVIPRGDSNARTLRNVLAIPDTLERLATLKAWCAELPREEVLTLLEEFHKMMEAEERIGGAESFALMFQSIDVITSDLASRGAREALDLLNQPRPEEDDPELREGAAAMVFTKWAAADLPAARAWLEERTAKPEEIGDRDQELAKGLMRTWVKTDPDAAFAWLAKQPASLSEGAAEAAFQALSHVDSEKARRLVAAQADRPGRDGIAGELAGWWAKEAPAEALRWARGLPETLAAAAVKASIGSWAEQDFAAAAQAAADLSPTLKDAVLPTLVDNRNSRPGETAQWLEKQPDGPGRQQAVGELVRRWAGANPEEASAWLAAQPEGPARDQGVDSLADRIRYSDPEAAAVWGATLSNERMRMQSLRDTLKSWYRISLPHAENWLRTAPQLSDSDRVHLMGGPAPP